MQYFKILLSTALISLCLLTLSSAKADHAPLDKYQWSYDTDPYGSEAIINHKLIIHGGIWIKFKRVPRINAQRNTWAHLIHKIPSATLNGVKKIRLTYQSERPLLVKLPQKEYSKNGDKSNAYYQIELPASKQWLTKEVSIKDFKRPLWTPEKSIDLGLLTTHIKAIHFTPNFTDKDGGEAIIQVRAIELLP